MIGVLSGCRRHAVRQAVRGLDPYRNTRGSDMKRTAIALALLMPLASGSALAAAKWAYKDVASGQGTQLISKQFTKVSGDIYRH